MFCGNCGKEISEDNRFCPYCAAPNKKFNNTGSKTFDEQISNFVLESSILPKDTENLSKIKSKKACVIKIVICFIVMFSIITIALTVSSKPKEKNKSILARINSDNAIFIDENSIRTIEGKFKDGIAFSKTDDIYLIDKKNNLLYYSSPESEPEILASDVKKIEKATEKGVVYQDRESIQFYNIKTKSTFQFFAAKDSNNNAEVVFSACRLTAAGIGKDGHLYIYKERYNKSEEICDLSDKEAKICGISNNGKTVVWAVKDNNGDMDIYMSKKGIPEWVGSMSGSYAQLVDSIYVVFFNDGKDFITYGSYYSNIIWYSDNNSKEIGIDDIGAVPSIMSLDGKTTDLYNFENTNPDKIYLVSNTGDFIFGGPHDLLLINKNGNVHIVVSDIKHEYIIKHKLYFIDEKNNLYGCSLNKNLVNKKELITTDILGDIVFSENNKYAFFGKMGKIYRVNISGFNHSLEEICDWKDSSATLDYDLVVSDNGKTVYYISETRGSAESSVSLSESYTSLGELYKCTINSNPIKITDNVDIILKLKDSAVIIKRKNNDTYDIGIVEDNEYKELFPNVSV